MPIYVSLHLNSAQLSSLDEFSAATKIHGYETQILQKCCHTSIGYGYTMMSPTCLMKKKKDTPSTVSYTCPRRFGVQTCVQHGYSD